MHREIKRFRGTTVISRTGWWLGCLLVTSCVPNQQVALGSGLRDASVCSDTLPGQVWVSVLDSVREKPLNNAVVRVTSSSCSAAAGRSGRVHFSGLPVGPNRFRILFVGYNTIDTTMVLTSSAPEELSIRLTEWDDLRSRCHRGGCEHLDPHPPAPGIQLSEDDRLREAAIQTALYLSADLMNPRDNWSVCISVSTTTKRDPSVGLLNQLRAYNKGLWATSECDPDPDGGLRIRSSGAEATLVAVDLLGKERDGRRVMIVSDAVRHCVYSRSAAGWRVVRCPLLTQY